MAADAGIFQQYLNPVRSVADYRGDMDKQEQNALTLAAGRMSNQTAQQAQADDQAARQAWANSGGDPTKTINALQAVGLYKQAQTVQKGMLDNQESQAKITHFGAQSAESTQKTATARAEAIGQTLGALSKIDGGATPQHVTNAMQHMVDIGQISPEMAQKIVAGAPADPSQMQSWLLQGQRAVLGVKDQLPKFQTIDTGGAVRTGAVDPVTGAFTPAQTMTKTQTPDSVASVARAAADAAAGRAQADRHFNTTQAAGKVPAGYRANQDGSMSYIPGGPADPNTGGGKMTEDQGKATGWLVQAENAFGNMKNAMAKDPSSAKPGFNDALASVPSFGATEALANTMRSAPRQMFMQGASSLSEALLRAATGAGVNRDEAVQKIREITPVAGEAAETTAQKMAAIPLYIESLKVRAGPGAKKASGVLAGAAPTAASASSIPAGWTFKEH